MDGYQVTTVRSAHPARPSAPGVLIMARFKRTGGNFFAPLFAGRTSLTGTSAGWLRIGKHCALPKLGDDIFPRCCRENGCNEIAQQQLDKKQLKNVAANLTAAVCVCVVELMSDQNGKGLLRQKVQSFLQRVGKGQGVHSMPQW